ncbi:hypothetical protein FDP41_003204 [Naegleria fowleri]|uniref:Peptidase S54 rhomboid domain-containing protein n=1 Tax=Naegleria fowleri TaxID=5763 RepID=A0A6A5BT28_NAEFO|nr:uncharacterized protein FDP41_003204 [Naegleria fowleri]KAF0977882.1 hypothetical protein FDP41_003204 [Naegleria fowleri]
MIYLFEQIAVFPLSFTLVSINTIIFFILSFGKVPSEFVSYNYDKIVREYQIWRVVTSTFSHFSIIHILFNMGSMWSMRSVELIGQEHPTVHTFHSVVEYFKITVLLILLSFLFITLVYFCLIKFLKWENYRQVNIVGYSGVLFGIMTLETLQQGISSTSSSMFGLNLPAIIRPFMALILTSLLLPQASFVGHLGGIIGAFIIYYGILVWMIDIVFIVLLSILVLIVLGSVVFTTWRNRNSITVPSFLKRYWERIASVFRRSSNLTIRGGVMESHQILSEDEESDSSEPPVNNRNLANHSTTTNNNV